MLAQPAPDSPQLLGTFACWGSLLYGVQVYPAQYSAGILRTLSHEANLGTGPLAHHPAAAAVPAHILSHPVRLRLQDQFRRDLTERPAVHERHQLHPRPSPAPHRNARELPLSAHRRGLWRRLPVFAAHRVLLHAHLSGARLSDGLCDRTRAEVDAGTA